MKNPLTWSILLFLIAPVGACSGKMLLGVQPDELIDASLSEGDASGSTDPAAQGVGASGGASSTTPDAASIMGGSPGFGTDAATAGATSTAGAGNCEASCSTPAGAVHTFHSVGEVLAAVAGRWQICAGGLSAFPGAPADTIGVEFGPVSETIPSVAGSVGGNLYYLVQGDSGPVRGAGLDYQLVYRVFPNSTFDMRMYPTPNSVFGGDYRYSSCPKELQVSIGSSGNGEKALLLPL